MSTPYIPPRDVDLVTWADNFSALITASPSTYGLDAGDASTIAGLVATWDAAYALAVNPSTRTPVTIADKNTAKLAMLPVVRAYASQIRLNPGVANADKTALGLNLPNNSPAPIPAPATMPVITVVQNQPLRTLLKFRDELASPTSRAKAPNSIGLELRALVSTTPGTDPDAAPYVGTFTKVPFFLDWDPTDAGKVVTFWGRWINRAGTIGINKAQVGPWSTGVTSTIVNA